jgi:hypothetical protein
MGTENPNLDLLSLGESGDLGVPSDKILEENALATLEKEGGAEDSQTSSSALHVKRRAAKAPMVVSEFRRSIRLEGKSNGFKSEVGSQERDCFCYSVQLPNLSGKAIRSLGRIFAKFHLKND